MPTGTAIMNFGTIGAVGNSATVDVTGQTAIVAGSLVEAWLRLAATAEHPLDDMINDPIRVSAGNIVAGDRFTIYGLMPYGSAYGNYLCDWASI